MNKFLLPFATLAAIGCATAHSALAQAKLSVEVNQPGHAVSPQLWGLFFEDINLSADGGIYPELVRNRSFEDGEQAQYWKLAGGQSEMSVDSSQPLNPYNRHSLRINVAGGFSLENEGYWGMNI